MNSTQLILCVLWFALSWHQSGGGDGDGNWGNSGGGDSDYGDYTFYGGDNTYYGDDSDDTAMAIGPLALLFKVMGLITAIVVITKCKINWKYTNFDNLYSIWVINYICYDSW